MESQEKIPMEYRILKVEKPDDTSTFNFKNSQLETILKAFQFGKLGVIIFSLILCLQMPGNTSMKSKVAIVLLKIIQYIFFRVLGVRIKSSKRVLELLETFYYKTQKIYNDEKSASTYSDISEPLNTLKKKLLM